MTGSFLSSAIAARTFGWAAFTGTVAAAFSGGPFATAALAGLFAATIAAAAFRSGPS